MVILVVVVVVVVVVIVVVVEIFTSWVKKLILTLLSKIALLIP